MFRLLRYFSIASLASIILAAVALGTFHELSEKSQLLMFGESRNILLAQDFSRRIWPQFRSFANTASLMDPETLRHHPELSKLTLSVHEAVRNTATIEVEIYQLDGRKLFSTRATQIGMDADDNPGFVSAKRGQVFSEITHYDQYPSLDGEVANRDVLSSYIPVHSSEISPIDGVMMIATDISDLVASNARQQRLVTASVVAVLAALYGLLFFIVRHADHVIRKQNAHRLHIQQNLQHVTTHDALTNLPNRLLLLDRVTQSLTSAERRNNLLALAVIDLDNFQSINNSLGHHLGDKVLQTVAQRLEGCLRENDTVARLGGDEFVVSLPDIHSSLHLFPIARKMLGALSLPIEVEGREFHLTASIGIALYPQHGKDAETLMRKADLAMHSAKRLGRNRHQMFAEHMDERVQQQVQMEEEMWRALENEFVLYYQPVIDLNSGVIIGAEALLRWPNNHGAWFSPNEFIPLTENCGLLEPLSEWVLSEACTQLQAWQESKHGLDNFTMGVNLSSIHFATAGMATMVAEVIEQAGIDPAKLQLEIADGLLTGMNEVMRSNFDELKRIGIKFSLDNFGTGYSSLGYLRNFPIDMLKIDRSFVQDLPHNTDNMAIITTIISLAQSLNLAVVAKGVETAEQLVSLQRVGCQFAQGFLFSVPLPAEEFLSLMFDRRDLRKPL
jgi:diguanylate cyclase (GGDEF)-like protein